MNITKAEILMGRDKTYAVDYTQEISDNIDKLLPALNLFREAYGIAMVVSSGWRPESINKSVGGASKSNHMIGLACDFKDHDGKITEFALKMDQEGKLKEWGLWLENPKNTPGWCHLDVKNRGDRQSNMFNP